MILSGTTDADYDAIQPFLIDCLEIRAAGLQTLEDGPAKSLEYLELATCPRTNRSLIEEYVEQLVVADDTDESDAEED